MSYKLFNILIIATAVFILRLATEDKLTLYIHPRYIVFTIALTVIGLTLSILSFYSSQAKITFKQLVGFIPLIILVVLALTLPPRSLTSFSVAQRQASSSPVVSSGTRTLSFYNGSSKNLNVAEWYRLLSSNSNPEFYINREVSVSGFIYDTGSKDTFEVARFVVTCCTVDAQPTGLTVYKPKWRDELKQDQWIQIEGKIINNPDKTQNNLIVEPVSIDKISEPANPYAN